MTLAGFVLAVLALLLAPGPTNTLMGVAGARHGPGRVLRLLPAELAGYLTVILPLAFLGAPLLAAAPVLASLLKLASALWVAVLALRLWRVRAGAAAAAVVTARRIYATTLLNPKALVFGLVLLPGPQDAAFPARLALFGLMVGAAALVWGGAGVLTGGRRLETVQRLAAIWLGMVAASLLLGAVPG